MEKNGNVLVFEYLSSPSRSIVGDKEQIKANTLAFENAAPFVFSNAKGDLRNIASLEDAENIGKAAGRSLTSMFA